MAPPKLQVSVEPFDSGKVTYAPMAAPAAGQPEAGRLMLRLSITNKECVPITMQNLKVDLLGQGTYPSTTLPIAFFFFTMGVEQSTPLTISPSASALWWFQHPADDIIFPVDPAPDTIKLSFTCVGVSTPKTFTFPLAPHETPTPQGSYLFPARAADLRPQEYWRTNGATHGIGAEGSQSFAYDMGVFGFDEHGGGWSWLLPKTTGDENDDLRIWGKPIYAMADGMVRHCLYQVPSNPHPLKGSTQEELDKELAEQKDKYWGAFESEHGGAGNHLYIQHGDEIVLYAHMQPDKIPVPLRTVGAPVTAGELLGLAGNSGNSSAPHLHVHAIRGKEAEVGPLRPFLFRGISVLDAQLVTPSPSDPWVPADGKAIPPIDTDIWPGILLRPDVLGHDIYEVAVDPLSLILPSDVYVRFTLPDPPPIDVWLRQLRRSLVTMTPAQKRQLLQRLETYGSHTGALAKEVRASIRR
jgi:hypothetical protein